MRRWLETLGHDLGYAIRSFRRSPAFVLVALLSLTLGIGATSAIFSGIYGVLISPYPYAKPKEIWAPEVRGRDGRGGHAYSLDELRSLVRVPAFSDVMATSIETVLLTGEFAPESFGGVLLSGNAFNFLGVPPVVGRTIQPTDIRPDEGHVHLYVNNSLVSMNYGLEQDVPVNPGTIVIKAEFVAADHAPFNPRVWSDEIVVTITP